MKLDAVLHLPMSEYAHGLTETKIVYRLRCARDDLIKVTLFYGDTACRVTPILFTPVPMEKAASDELHDYWEVIAESAYKRVYYYFRLDDGSDTLFYYGNVFTDHLVDDRSQYFKLPFNHRADLAVVPDWVKDAVVYNIFPDSFASARRFLSGLPSALPYENHTVHGRLGGTLKGIAENIDYLLELGINCVYLNPIFAAGEYHKYDLLDYYHVDPCFGGDAAFRELVEKLHASGIRILIDGVFNHCGWQFFAFDDVVQNQKASPYCDWFYGLQFPVRRPESPEEYPSYDCFAYERMMPKLNTANPQVRDYFCRVGQYWVEQFGIDGWRLDVASEVDDGFWRAFRKAVKQVNSNALLVGEIWESANHWLSGDMFDSAMNYDFRKHCNLFFAEGAIDAFAFSGRVTDMLMRYKHQITPAQMNLLDSHDVSRFLTLCHGNHSVYKLAILFQMTFVGMPTIFYGNELGIAGIDEEEYRKPMPWGSPDRALFDFFKRAVKLRHDFSCLRRGSFRTVSAEIGSRVFCYTREDEISRITVCMNAGTDPVIMPERRGTILWSENTYENRLLGYGFAVLFDNLL